MNAEQAAQAEQAIRDLYAKLEQLEFKQQAAQAQLPLRSGVSPLALAVKCAKPTEYDGVSSASTFLFESKEYCENSGG